MGYEAKVILDSVSRGHRLTTMQITFPRIILAEFNTHRAFSRNSASSRAIPVDKRIASIQAEPFMPEAFGANKAGMQDGGALDVEANALASVTWANMISEAVHHAKKLAAAGVHKHWANRLIEFCSWHTCVVSSTEWPNYDALRDHPAAAPEIRTVTQMMRTARAASVPREIGEGDWHLPYVSVFEPSVRGWAVPQDEAYAAAKIASAAGLEILDVLRMVSVGRSAAVSYNRQETTEFDKAVDIYKRLKSSGHMSPFEHPARPMTPYEYEFLFQQPELEWDERAGMWKKIGALHFCGNFQGWVQDRKMIRHESDFSRVSTSS